MRLVSLALVIHAAVFAAADTVKFQAKPGLWETTSVVETSGAPPMQASASSKISPEVLAKMPPEQRAKIEAMMKGGPTQPRTHVVKACMTQEKIDRGFSMAPEMQNRCKQTVVSSTSSRQQIHVECNGDHVQSSGDMTIERVDSGHVKGGMTSKTTGDATVSMKMTFDSKWLSTDCGDVKPTK